MHKSVQIIPPSAGAGFCPSTVSWIYYSIKYSRWFKLEWSLSWRSRDPWNGHVFIIPNSSPRMYTWIFQGHWCLVVKMWGFFLPTRIPNEKDGITGGSTSTKNRRSHWPSNHEPSLGCNWRHNGSCIFLGCWMHDVLGIYTPFLGVQIAPFENAALNDG